MLDDPAVPHRLLSYLCAVVCCAALCVGAPSSARACVHAAHAAATPVTQKGQRILVVHDGKAQTTVVQIDYEVGKGLADLAMVLPVPSVPTRYETGDPKLFAALEAWVPLERQEPQPRARAAGSKALLAAVEPPAIELLAPVKTGPYTIQPIKARGSAGAKAVNTWLTDNSYAPIPDEALGYYIDQEWAFLAVKTSPADGELAKTGALPPLSFSFPSDRIVVPLKLEAQGVFPVRVYTVSPRVLSDEDFSGAMAKGFEVASAPGHGHLRGVGTPSKPLAAPVGAFGRSTAPSELGAVFAAAGLKAPELHLRVLFREDFGSGAADPSLWADELAVPKLASAGSAKSPPTPQDTAPDSKPATAPDSEPATAPDSKKANDSDSKAVAPEPATKSAPPKREPAKSCAVGRRSDLPASVWLLALLGFRRRRR